MGKQRLQQKQSLSLSPQQIQFLSLLQIPVIELEKRIKEELEENPALEENLEDEDEGGDDFNYSQNYKKGDFSNIQIENTDSSLFEYLQQQLITLDLDEKFLFLINYLINSLDDNGFLTTDLHSISSDLLINSGVDVSEFDLQKALAVLQKLEPFGIGAKTLQESLMIQLKKKHPKNTLAQEIIGEHYVAFSNKNYERLTKTLNLSVNELKQVYLTVESLDPKPASRFSKNSLITEYIYPDFTVVLKNNSPELLLNKSNTKKIQVSSYYESLLKETTEKLTKEFLKQNIEKASWFKSALLKRDETLKRVMLAIIHLQKAYFITGDEKDLAPMKLADVAQIVKLDISTISRVSNSKYVNTHFGTFKIKELFSEAYRKDDGVVISNKQIKSQLKKLINNEDTTRPFTDEELSELLGKNDYHIARRTVAKYREALGLQTAKQRRSL